MQKCAKYGSRTKRQDNIEGLVLGCLKKSEQCNDSFRVRRDLCLRAFRTLAIAIRSLLMMRRPTGLKHDSRTRRGSDELYLVVREFILTFAVKISSIGRRANDEKFGR